MKLYYTKVVYVGSLLPLTDQQLRAIEVLEWLLDPRFNRRQGRTVATAIALIRIAARHPQQWIQAVDHSEVGAAASNVDVRVALVDLIEVLVREEPLLRAFFERRQMSFCFNMPGPLEGLEIDMGGDVESFQETFADIARQQAEMSEDYREVTSSKHLLPKKPSGKSWHERLLEEEDYTNVGDP